MKLWAMLCRATQDEWVIVGVLTQCGPLEKGMANHFSILAWRTPHPVVDVTGDGSKVWCCEEQYCIRTWNVRCMNQSELEVVKQEIARVNIDILGISELKCIGMGKFNSDDHYIYYYREESLRRNGVVIIVNERVWNGVLRYNLKNDRMISVSKANYSISQ